MMRINKCKSKLPNFHFTLPALQTQVWKEICKTEEKSAQFQRLIRIVFSVLKKKRKRKIDKFITLVKLKLKYLNCLNNFC